MEIYDQSQQSSLLS